MNHMQEEAERCEARAGENEKKAKLNFVTLESEPLRANQYLGFL